MKKLIIASLFTSVAMAGSAYAQTATPDAATAPMAATAGEGGFLTYQEGNQMLGSGLMGADVWGADNESIGSVDDLLLDRDGQVQAIILNIGGFLGIGARNVAISTDELEFVLAQDVAGEAPAAGGMAADPAVTADPTTPAAPAAGVDPAAPAATGGTAMGTGATGAAGTGATGTAGTGMAGSAETNENWGWTGAGIERIQVNYTREQLENAPEFETAE